MKNRGRVPYGKFNKHLHRVKDLCNTITRKMINKTMQLHQSSCMYENNCFIVSNEDNDTNDNFSGDRGTVLSELRLYQNMKISYVVSKFTIVSALNM